MQKRLEKNQTKGVGKIKEWKKEKKEDGTDPWAKKTDLKQVESETGDLEFCGVIGDERAGNQALEPFQRAETT